ncbi:hypothetical protein XENOCAPTIV_012347 [Xenoophorus captivus]|uniref:Uncharacterized protein n=1 Tax=Xenoophorus captivus TaxID=1517983 RepID=A0ABV0RR34_9TELE
MQKDLRLGVKPRAFLLQGKSATNCATVQPTLNFDFSKCTSRQAIWPVHVSSYKFQSNLKVATYSDPDGSMKIQQMKYKSHNGSNNASSSVMSPMTWSQTL